jgi:hypothetical protein
VASTSKTRDRSNCQERDGIILAFALAANERNIAVGDLEEAATDAERREAQTCVNKARDCCFELRDLILRHCSQHGC